MSDLCRCADEVRCDMRKEIERLTFIEKNHLQGIAWLEKENERLTALADQIRTDWIPANRQLQARVDELESQQDTINSIAVHAQAQKIEELKARVDELEAEVKALWLEKVGRDNVANREVVT